jgi:hypothetical protein
VAESVGTREVERGRAAGPACRAVRLLLFLDTSALRRSRLECGGPFTTIRTSPIEVDIVPIEVEIVSIEVDIVSIEMKIVFIEVEIVHFEMKIVFIEVEIVHFEVEIVHFEVEIVHFEVEIVHFEVEIVHFEMDDVRIERDLVRIEETTSGSKRRRPDRFFPRRAAAAWGAAGSVLLPYGTTRSRSRSFPVMRHGPTDFFCLKMSPAK